MVIIAADNVLGATDSYCNVPEIVKEANSVTSLSITTVAPATIVIWSDAAGTCAGFQVEGLLQFPPLPVELIVAAFVFTVDRIIKIPNRRPAFFADPDKRAKTSGRLDLTTEKLSER
jgi:hypothetical protein